MRVKIKIIFYSNKTYYKKGNIIMYSIHITDYKFENINVQGIPFWLKRNYTIQNV